MRASFCIAVLAPALGAVVLAQTTGKKAVNLAQLELTSEIAATTDGGYPAALRVMVKNVGSTTVTMPVLGSGCHPDNGVAIESFWMSTDEHRGIGGGGGCAVGDQPALAKRARTLWIKLRPGEYMTTMLHVTWAGSEAGMVEYWVEYLPPDATSREIGELAQEGYVIPTEKLQTEHRSFEIH
jgi:hypothetical protein